MTDTDIRLAKRLRRQLKEMVRLLTDVATAVDAMIEEDEETPDWEDVMQVMSTVHDHYYPIAMDLTRNRIREGT